MGIANDSDVCQGPPNWPTCHKVSLANDFNDSKSMRTGTQHRRRFKIARTSTTPVTPRLRHAQERTSHSAEWSAELTRPLVDIRVVDFHRPAALAEELILSPRAVLQLL